MEDLHKNGGKDTDDDDDDDDESNRSKFLQFNEVALFGHVNL